MTFDQVARTVEAAHAAVSLILRDRLHLAGCDAQEDHGLIDPLAGSSAALRDAIEAFIDDLQATGRLS